MKKIALSFLLLAATATLQSQLQPVDNSWVEKTLKSMTLDEKIGQLFIPAQTSPERTLEWIQKYNIGGIWFARVEAKKIVENLNTFQRVSKYPLLVTVDFEKGAGTYVDGATDLPINMALGASRNPQLVYEAAKLTAKEARALGVHLNYAPVLDVNNNPRNPVINTRSYGEDPKLVATMAVAAIRGYQENGLLATAKHFPGHGNTGTDTHANIGVIAGSPKEVESVELYPYKQVFRLAKPSSVMSAHLWIQSIDLDTIPATLSGNVMTGLLRDRLKFDGLVLTDAMVMGGITTRYPFNVATVKALQAGCDIILFPGDLEIGINAVREALKSGGLTERRIDESVRRILRAKSKAGLQKHRITDIDRVGQLVGTTENYQIAKKIAAGCLTLAKDDATLIPLKASKKVLVLTMSNKEGNSMVSRGLVTFPDEVRKHAPGSTELRLSDSLRADEIEKALELARQADVVIVAAYVKIVLSSGTVELPATHTAFLQRLIKSNQNLALVSFGNPYIGGSVPEIPTYICAYDNAKALQETAAEALFGKAHFRGKLPVTISETMRFGMGLVR
ncbi:MAG: glycoside hydrolase family 3 C-terminal domain-containing protein [Ignavibacteriales bacterium]|nr:glycoside hydrolase family 3 C-terminal domain-containing protein [Ignavibacteriales bacterium]